MTAADREALWQQLLAAGLVQGDLPASSAVDTPWYVRLMLGAAGWLGAWFFVGFFASALLLVFRNSAATLAVGALCCAGAWLLFRASRRSNFVSQFGLAASLAGQVLVVFGLFDLLGDELSAGSALAVVVFQAILVFNVDNFIHRVWSTIAAVIALSLVPGELGVAGINGLAAGATAWAFVWIWLHEPSWVTNGVLWRPMGYGVAIALVWLDGFVLASETLRHNGQAPLLVTRVLTWLGPALTGGALIYAVRQLLDRTASRSGRLGLVVMGATGLIAVLGIGAPGVSAALLMVIVGFAGGLRVLVGIGAASLLGYLFWFYYSLHATLLVKSGVLTATGIALIGAWFGLRTWLDDEDSREEASHA